MVEAAGGRNHGCEAIVSIGYELYKVVEVELHLRNCAV